MDEIDKGLICPDCREATEVVTAAEAGATRREGLVRRCPKCGAYVHCHPGTDRGMGRVADAELRRLRRKAHEAFDRLWRGPQKVKKSRYNAYSWLALRLKMNKDRVHFALFDKETCRRVIALCRAKLEKA